MTDYHPTLQRKNPGHARLRDVRTTGFKNLKLTGSVAEQLQCWTCNSKAPSSSPAVTASRGFVHGSPGPRFKSSAMPVNSQPVCLPPVGILNPVMFDLDQFHTFARPLQDQCYLYYYMGNFCNLIGLEQWYFRLI